MIRLLIGVLAALAMAGCGGGGAGEPAAAPNYGAVTTSGSVTTVAASVSAAGGELRLPSGERLLIPSGALSTSTDIKLAKEGLTYRLLPEGLVANSAMQLIIPVGQPLLDLVVGKHVVAYLYSEQSQSIQTNSGVIKADRLLMLDGSELTLNQDIQLPIRHFSLVRVSIQDRSYIPLEIPARYLKKGDIVFALSHENYEFCALCPDFYRLTPRDQFSFDWFPGHAAMIADPNGALQCSDPTRKTCDLVEATPPMVRVSQLGADFVNPAGHVYMGARRPREFSISPADGDSVVTWGVQQLGKPWTFLNDHAVFDGSSYSQFSCVGLVEAAYKKALGKGIINDSWRWLQDDGYVRPLDLYDKTKPVDSIDVGAGETLVIRANPVFLSQDKSQYFDVRSQHKGSADYAFVATDLPAGASFDPATGTLRWQIPLNAQPGSHRVKFALTNSWPKTLLTGKITETRYEYLSINVAAASANAIVASFDGTGYVFDNFSLQQMRSLNGGTAWWPKVAAADRFGNSIEFQYCANDTPTATDYCAKFGKTALRLKLADGSVHELLVPSLVSVNAAASHAAGLASGTFQASLFPPGGGSGKSISGSFRLSGLVVKPYQELQAIVEWHYPNKGTVLVGRGSNPQAVVIHNGVEIVGFVDNPMVDIDVSTDGVTITGMRSYAGYPGNANFASLSNGGNFNGLVVRAPANASWKFLPMSDEMKSRAGSDQITIVDDAIHINMAGLAFGGPNGSGFSIPYTIVDK